MVSRVGKFTEQKVEWWCPGFGGREKWRLYNGYRVLVLQDEKFWRLDV